MTKICYICYSQTEPEFICDKCEQFYCEDCSYTFTIHYQYEGSQCYWCSDQCRKKPLNLRNSKIDYIIK